MSENSIWINQKLTFDSLFFFFDVYRNNTKYDDLLKVNSFVQSSNESHD